MSLGLQSRKKARIPRLRPGWTGNPGTTLVRRSERGDKIGESRFKGPPTNPERRSEGCHRTRPRQRDLSLKGATHTFQEAGTNRSSKIKKPIM